MRFNKRVTFIYQTSKYSPELQKHIESVPIEHIRPCNLAPLSMKRRQELFGSVNTAITVIRLRRPFTKKYTAVMYKDQLYVVNEKSEYKKGVLYVEGDMLGPSISHTRG